MSARPCTTVVEPFAAAEQEFETITAFLRSGEACSLTHSDLERTLEVRGRELVRTLLQGHLDLRRPGEAVEPVHDADGVARSREQLHDRTLESLFGTVTVSRTGYGAAGTTSLHPLDGALNLPGEKYSHEVRRRVAIEAAKSAFDEGVKTLEAYTGAHVPKRQFEELVVRAAEDFDAFYETRHECAKADPHAGSILVLTVDGKGVVMRPEDLREATRRAAATRADTFTARLGRGRRLHAKRMASVAAVYTIAPFVRAPEDILPPPGKTAEEQTRPRPERKRVWASLEQTPDEVITAMFDEAEHRDPTHRKTWVALVDGNKPQIRILRTLARTRHIPLQIVVDFIHVAEYVWKAGLTFHPAESQALDSWVRARLLEILRGHASYVAAGMRRSATRRSLPAAVRAPVDACADYLLTYAPYLKYHIALSTGLPIATGVIEGACRHLINDRMNLTGARWSLMGAEAVLRLRALRSSDDFTDYWFFHELSEYQRNHASLYPNQHVPATTPPQQPAPSRRTLTLVKK
ncbi:hypothetical protein BH23GEM3_BH23GEM3_25680 [soil metagenome]|nr:ISKra4 family transposase [Acidobacteriota bacterium]